VQQYLHARGDSRYDVDISLEPDPVIEAFKKDVDRTLIRENLKVTPEQRLLKLQAFVNALEELRGSARSR
jgi:hypothetical protein